MHDRRLDSAVSEIQSARDQEVLKREEAEHAHRNALTLLNVSGGSICACVCTLHDAVYYDATDIFILLLLPRSLHLRRLD